MTSSAQLLRVAADREGDFESLLCEISTRFINLRVQHVDLAVENAQRLFCEWLGLDRSTLWQSVPDAPDLMELTHFYEPGQSISAKTSDHPLLHDNGCELEGKGPTTAYRRMAAKVFFPWVLGRLKGGESVVIERLRDLPEEAVVDAGIFRRYGTRSTVIVPLRMESRWLGCLSFATVQAEREFTREDVRRFETIGHLFAHALARKSADLELRKNEARLQAILDSAADGIITVDPQGVILSANRTAERLFGYPVEELVGQNARILMPLPFRDRREDPVLNYLGNGETTVAGEHRELEGLRKNGKVFPIELSISESVTDQGRFFTGFIRDISDRKKAEKSLGEAEQAARDLSGRLINAHEDERARLARELHDDVSQRMARLAIDVGRIQRGGLANAAAENLLVGVHGGLVELSDDIHALSYELHPSAILHLGLVEALKAECDRFSRRESVTVEVALRDLPPAIPSDMAINYFRIAQEALRNAARHGRASAVEVTLWGLDGGVQLAVQDNGIGFNPGARRNVPSLGLASMRERIRMLGGELDVESDPGHGTTIVAWAPLEEFPHE